MFCTHLLLVEFQHSHRLPFLFISELAHHTWRHHITFLEGISAQAISVVCTARKMCSYSHWSTSPFYRRHQ